MMLSRSLFRELLQTVALTLVIFLGVRAGVQNFRVDGQSMEPNLQNGEYILVNKIDYMIQAPQRGDIIVFRAIPANEPDRDFVKRVIGLPGEKVAVHNGAVFINNRRLSEPYIRTPPDYTFPDSVVPPNNYFVLGDNRNNSMDSHMWRWLPREDIVGKAWISYWPPASVQVFQASPSLLSAAG